MDRFNIEILKKHDACRSQIKLFTKHFPDGAPLTVEAALSVSTVFDWNWAAKNLLTALNRDAYDAAVKPALEAYSAATKPAFDAHEAAMKPALEAYNAAMKPARDAYEAARDTALEAYGATINAAREAYGAAIKSAREAYDAAIKSAHEARNSVRAKAFAELYIKQTQNAFSQF